LSPEPAPSVRPARPRRGLLAYVIGAAVLAVVALLCGFALFVASVSSQPVQAVAPADGIVVLTGAPERIADATDLLIAQRGKRLLITGVHPDTTLTEISRTVPASREALECCVELGRAALNTRGNAIETAAWAHALGFRSLIVVTSAWHMPRALVELRRAMPDVALVPYPVVAKGPRDLSWQARLASARLLAGEYVKYLAAYVGVRPWPSLTAQPNGARKAGAF
jgi:uncharacterized SAM-binding protein YcdF (DUF218 family)